MKTIYIVRHAKSSWAYEGIADIDRPLKERGINDAHLMSKFLSKKIERPDIFISSVANRALHTSVIFCENFNYPFSNLKIKKELYSFSNGYLVKTVKALDDSFNTASVTDSSAGRFVVNIANDMANTGYAISVCARIPSGNVGVAVEDNGVARAAGTTPVYIINAGSYYDSTDTQVIINGDLA